ncbi:MAG: GMC family oxidoreductase N-terminal domain-containing protein [Pseudomonadota bacterium]
MNSFDYIVVGGGSAGCAVAARLAQDTACTICLLEAGPGDGDIRVKIPFALINLIGSKRDWRRRSAPMASLGGRQIDVPRGKLLGGSGSINSMLWFRGRQDDFDAWDVPGWRWSDVEPAFEEVETRTTPQRIGTAHPVSEAWGKLFGANDPDANSTPERESAGVVHTNMRRGRRWSAADAFLRPAQKSGRVEVLTRAEVLRLSMAGDRATGVVLKDGREIAARGAVVLSAGAIESPMILMRSGLGPSAHLRERGIDVIRDIPGVGANLHDHPSAGLHFVAPHSGYGLTLRQLPVWAAAPFQYAIARKGVLASPTVEANAFFRAMPGDGPPDAQSHFIPFKLNWSGSKYSLGSGYYADVVVCRPRSRGRLTMSADTLTPHIDFNLLSDPYDMEVLERGLPKLRQMAMRAPFGARRAEEKHPGPEVTGDALRAHIRSACATAYHPVGTIAMGADGPLDSQLRLRGVRGLFVADASVMPRITSANTNAPSMMIGWRGGDLIAKSNPHQ